MSLYSSLTQVLAPFAAKINGLLTGWDGTKYSTPGEAIRQQISDLHVLIGDIQGDAKISGSAVGYDGTESGLSATTMQGAIDEVSGDVTAVNGRLVNLKEDLSVVATGEAKIYPTFHMGYVHELPDYTPQNPADNTHHNTVCTTDYISVSEAKKIYFDNTTYKIVACYYDADKVYKTYAGFITTPNPYVLNTDYAYCVIELRKHDASAFSDADVEATNGTVYYEKTIADMDIIRSADLASAVSGIESEISALGTKKEIQSSFFPALLYKVYRTVSGYVCETPQYGGSDWVTIYVDSANGSDENDGTQGHPVKTINKGVYFALKQMYDNSKKVVIEIAENSVFFYGDLPSSWGFTKSCVIRAENNATIFAGKKPSFTASGNHYVSEALTSYTPVGCVDTSETDDYGIFKTMIPATSENDVNETENSYYIDSTNKVVYVHPANSIDDVVVIFSDNYAVNPGAYSFTESGFVMLENIRFVGNSTATGRASSTVGETISRSIYVRNCIFEHGFTNNCVSFNDFDYTYLVDCVAGYAKRDCFNYHFTRKPTPTNALVVEVNCKSKESGYYDTVDASDNLTTCHDGANIIRCGCYGYNGNGPLCADVNGCYSVCIDCSYLNTSYTEKPAGANKSAFHFDNTYASRNGKTVLQNCYGYDSRNNRLVKAVDLILNGVNAGGSIEYTSVKIGTELY